MTAGINRDYECTFAQSASDGLKAGATRLALSYRGTRLLLLPQTQESLLNSVNKIAELAQKLDDYSARNAALRGSFSRAAKRFFGKGMSFLGEYSSVFAATAAGSFTGPWGGVAGAAGTTYFQALGAAFLRDIENAGYDLKAPDQVLEALSDKELVKTAKKHAYLHAGQMSTGVVLAGAVAGYVHALASKPVASAGASALRSLMPKVAEKSAVVFGDFLAQGFKSAVNALSRKAVERVPVKAMFLSAAVTGAAIEAQAQYSQNDQTRGLPNYNTSRLYL